MTKSTRHGIADARQDIETLRSQLRDLATARAMLAKRPMVKDEIGARVEDFIAGEELRARDWVTFSALGAPVTADSSAFTMKAAFAHHPIGALTLLGFGQQVREALVGEAVKSAHLEPISFEERQREYNRIDAETDTIGATIELIIRGAEDTGSTIDRDPYADPRHVLAKDL
jgi:hypothetical protein